MPQIWDWIIAPWQSPLVMRGGMIALLAGVPAAAVGSWVILRDLPYAAESLAHGMFPGILAALWIGLPVAIGGLCGLALAGGLILIARRAGIEPDAAVAVSITPLLGIGALLAGASGLGSAVEGVLFGDLLGTGNGELAMAAVIAVLVGVALAGSHWRLLASGLGNSGGNRADAIVIAMLAAVTLTAARSLGALLAVALVIGPAAAARHLTRRAAPTVLVASAIAAGSVLCGVELSWHAELPTGPAIALCAIIPAAAAATLARSSRLGRAGSPATTEI